MSPSALQHLLMWKQRPGAEPSFPLHFQHVSEEPMGSFVWFEYLALMVRLPGPILVISLLLIERKERGLMPYLVASPGHPTFSNTAEGLLSTLQKIGLLGPIPSDLKNP